MYRSHAASGPEGRGGGGGGGGGGGEEEEGGGMSSLGGRKHWVGGVKRGERELDVV